MPLFRVEILASHGGGYVCVSICAKRIFAYATSMRIYGRRIAAILFRSCEFCGDMPAISGRCRAALPHCEQFRTAGRILGLRYTVQLASPLNVT